MNKNNVIVFLVILFIGCAQSNRKNRYFKNYSLNSKQSANIGSPMIHFEDITYIEGKQWIGCLNSPDGWKHYKYPTKDSFREELIYSGRSNNIIHFSYREYKENFARPAFYQELKYDLKKSKIIVFKYYRIRVLEATNENIVFKVLSDFNPVGKAFKALDFDDSPAKF